MLFILLLCLDAIEGVLPRFELDWPEEEAKDVNDFRGFVWVKELPALELASEVRAVSW